MCRLHHFNRRFVLTIAINASPTGAKQQFLAFGEVPKVAHTACNCTHERMGPPRRARGSGALLRLLSVAAIVAFAASSVTYRVYAAASAAPSTGDFPLDIQPLWIASQTFTTHFVLAAGDFFAMLKSAGLVSTVGDLSIAE